MTAVLVPGAVARLSAVGKAASMRVADVKLRSPSTHSGVGPATVIRNGQ
jgi:hypothetical protein